EDLVIDIVRFLGNEPVAGEAVVPAGTPLLGHVVALDPPPLLLVGVAQLPLVHVDRVDGQVEAVELRVEAGGDHGGGRSASKAARSVHARSRWERMAARSGPRVPSCSKRTSSTTAW